LNETALEIELPLPADDYSFETVLSYNEQAIRESLRENANRHK